MLIFIIMVRSGQTMLIYIIMVRSGQTMLIFIIMVRSGQNHAYLHYNGQVRPEPCLSSL